MRVLIACEESQTECKAFRELGHEAYSCDVQECSGGHPEWHIHGDALEALNAGCIKTMDGQEHFVERWDLVIAHPPCTFISNAGACRLYPQKGIINVERYAEGLKAKLFFMAFWYYGYYGCGKIVIENPRPSKVFDMPPPTEVIQPYEHGDPFTKATLLWEFGVPKLIPTNIVKPIGPYVCGNADIWKKQAAKGRVYGKEKSSKHRSRAFVGISRAMAAQWGGDTRNSN